MNQHRSGPGQMNNKNKSHQHSGPKRDGQGVRPPNPNRFRRPPKKGDSRFLNNRNRNPQVNNQNGQGSQNNPNRAQFFDKVFKRYEYLQDQHCIARRKYFENYYKTEGSQRDKAEKNFYSTLEQLNDYVATLSAEQREAFEKKYNGYPTDTDYSKNHNLPEQAERVRFADKFEDPHILKSQKEKPSFASDTEESIGTIEDYNRYKGLD